MKGEKWFIILKAYLKSKGMYTALFGEKVVEIVLNVYSGYARDFIRFRFQIFLVSNPDSDFDALISPRNKKFS